MIGDGYVAADALRRRAAALEHPAVQAGRMTAQEAQRSLMWPARSSESLSLADFMAMHVGLSTQVPGDDAAFGQLLKRLWRLHAREEPAADARRGQDASETWPD